MASQANEKKGNFGEVYRSGEIAGGRDCRNKGRIVSAAERNETNRSSQTLVQYGIEEDRF
jgi:hypothetical protein